MLIEISLSRNNPFPAVISARFMDQNFNLGPGDDREWEKCAKIKIFGQFLGDITFDFI